MRTLWTTAMVVAVGSSQAGLYFVDDFSTFNTGNLVGQGQYTRLGAQTTLPLQVSSGRLVIPGGQTVNNEDALRNHSIALADGQSHYIGALMRINSASTATDGSAYLLAFRTGGFDNGRLVFRQSATSTNRFVVGIRATGQTGNPFVWGTTELDYGRDYTFVLALDTVLGTSNDVFSLFVNPTSLNRAANTPYATVVNAVTDPVTPLAGVTISQFGNATGVVTADASISRLAMGSDFGATTQAVPEPATMLALGAGVAALIARRRRR